MPCISNTTAVQTKPRTGASLAGWRILFVCPTTKKRRTIRTGKCAKKNAETDLNMIERLIEARQHGSPLNGQTVEWLKGIRAHSA